MTIHSAWTIMPPGMNGLLALGSVGKTHLTEAARLGAAEAAGLPDADRAPVLSWCRDVFLSALASDPLDGHLARSFLAGDRESPWLPESARRLCQALSAHFRPPEDPAAYQRLAARRDLPRLRAFLAGRLDREPENLFWLRQAMALAVFEGDADWTRELAARPLPAGLEEARVKLAADALYFSGRVEAALALWAGLAPVFGESWPLERAAFALARIGQREEALRAFRQALALAPWRANALLAAHDLSTGRDLARAELPGRLAVLLYTYNKAGDLAATLDSLSRAALGDARIFVLDNGSTDDTAAVLARASGPHPLTVVPLPVNVGAPAARNWLMNLPEVRACDWALYLDDDTDLPPDLRGRFGAAVAAYPGAGVWGCKVSDFDAPGRMQSADLHLVVPPVDPSRPALDLAADEPNPFRLSDLHVQEPDLGRFDYLRPCCSVTGCCHLFRAESLAEVGGFSLFLSPTQYDDVERDLRSALAGKPAVYQGHLAVGHRKSTGAASRTDPVAQGNALANKYKMQAMHERSRIKALAAWERELLLADLAAKARTLDHNP